MESKKTNRANLEIKKGIFLRIGFIIALALTLLAFEWRTSNKMASINYSRGWEVVDELLPVNTVQRKLPPPPSVAKPIFTIKIVDEPVSIPDDFPVIDAGPDVNWKNPVIPDLPDEPSIPNEDTIFRVVEKQPEFPGGLSALYEYLRKSIVYPKMAVESNIQGTVYISFVVEKNGSLSNILVVRSPHNVLSDEAVRVVSSMPSWSPGKQREKPVRVSFNLPIRFTLQ
jgi:periplasmic protein TonB